jgi:hypothetical protein
MQALNARYPIVVDGGYAAPGVCKFCRRGGNSDERGMTDGLCGDKFYGVVYICSYCVLEMAEHYGAASPSTMVKYMADDHQKTLKMHALEERLRKAEGVLHALGASGLLDAADNALNVSVVAEEEDPLPFVSDDDPDEPVTTGEGPQHEVDEPIDEQGPDDPIGLTGATSQQWDDLFG